ncbi:MAG: hypothetical protein ACK5MT_12260 [Actinomycetales bacterium]
MAWTWTYLDAAGSELAPTGSMTDTQFPTQADAESWVGEEWHNLVEDGVDAVTLNEDGAKAYGPMSLHPGS